VGTSKLVKKHIIKESNMSIFDELGKFVKDISEQVEDKIDEIVEEIADIFDSDDEEDSADAE
jgi:hypothetical protein